MTATESSRREALRQTFLTRKPVCLVHLPSRRCGRGYSQPVFTIDDVRVSAAVWQLAFDGRLTRARERWLEEFE